MEDPRPAELSTLLEPLALPVIVLARLLDRRKLPGALAADPALLMGLPATLGSADAEPAFLRLILLPMALVTIHERPVPALEDLAKELVGAGVAGLRDLPELMYMILDELADLSVKAQIDVRDRVFNLGRTLSRDAGKIRPNELTDLRWEVDRLASIAENQLYCVVGLQALDAAILNEPHRRPYLQDLVSELELAQRGIYRLDNRVNDLFSFYQMTQSDEVDRRLRILTIVSAVALPLGLIAGLLGMNVGGLPGGRAWYGFVVVVALMVVITVAELVYFQRRGWFR